MIVGLTGSLAAGKGFVADFFKEKGFAYFSLSDEIRGVMREEGIEITRKGLQDKGNQLRKENGNGILMKMVLKKIKNQDNPNVVIDGIRNPAEVDELKKMKGTFLISVDAPEDVRFERMVKRNRESDPINFEEFLKVDARDKGEGEDDSGQGVGKCMKLADYTINNVGKMEDVKNELEKLYLELKKRIPRPSWDEYFIEISRSVARRATCDRGRSGCVIARDKQILVTGYVGAPKGLPHCDDVGHQLVGVVHSDGVKRTHCVRTTHAEQNAICQAAKLGISIDKATLYCKMTPCSACAKMIINAGIKRVVCEKRYHAGAESEELFRQAGVTLDILNDEVEKYEGQ